MEIDVEGMIDHATMPLQAQISDLLAQITTLQLHCMGMSGGFVHPLPLSNGTSNLHAAIEQLDNRLAVVEKRLATKDIEEMVDI